MDVYLDRESFPLRFHDFDNKLVTISVDIPSASKFKFNNLFKAFKKEYTKKTGDKLVFNRLVLVVFGQEFVANQKDQEDPTDLLVGNNYTLKQMGISRYLEI